MATESGGDGGAWTIAIAVAAVLVNIVAVIGGFIWNLAHSSRSTDEKITANDKAKNDDLADLERRLRIEIDNTERNFGETIQAIRRKVTEIELWNRDNLVSKSDFADERRSRNRFEDQLNSRLDQIDRKLDRNNEEIN